MDRAVLAPFQYAMDMVAVTSLAVPIVNFSPEGTVGQQINSASGALVPRAPIKPTVLSRPSVTSSV